MKSKGKFLVLTDMREPVGVEEIVGNVQLKDYNHLMLRNILRTLANNDNISVRKADEVPGEQISNYLFQRNRELRKMNSPVRCNAVLINLEN